MSALIADRFDIDGQMGNGGVLGFHDPATRWNGWACPWFPIESVEIIAAWINTQGTERLTVDSDGVWVLDTEELDEVTPDPRGWRVDRIVHDGVELFGVGCGGWVWKESRE